MNARSYAVPHVVAMVLYTALVGSHRKPRRMKDLLAQSDLEEAPKPNDWGHSGGNC
jgi:hypothetical protein